jgi:hypothetical protein
MSLAFLVQTAAAGEAQHTQSCGPFSAKQRLVVDVLYEREEREEQAFIYSCCSGETEVRHNERDAKQTCMTIKEVFET